MCALRRRRRAQNSPTRSLLRALVLRSEAEELRLDVLRGRPVATGSPRARRVECGIRAAISSSALKVHDEPVRPRSATTLNEGDGRFAREAGEGQRGDDLDEVIGGSVREREDARSWGRRGE